MKPNKYLDDVLRGEELKSSEHTKTGFTEKTSTQKTENLERALNIYSKIVFAKEGELFGNIQSYINSLETVILTPPQIDLFFQTILKESKDKLKSHETGLYLTKLIQNSYNNGHNNFTLTIGNNTLNLVCYELKAKKERPLIITFDGIVGDLCCAFSEYIITTFNKHTGDNCCYESRNVVATFNEVVRNLCGRGTTNMIAIFNGKVGNNCGLLSENMSGTFNGQVGKNCGELSKNFIFKTRNIELYERMTNEFHKKGLDAKIELI